ncbi:hypothetical protein ACPOL_2634 [Acidisarcina polymorpha]|uniref:Uncharacterized protein n=1 Tax=Acidisarcina polymorpha TaxID=2211140 RepID=A0A2Z5FZM1_9BACT|nr:hypothetical protein [Acidisarcina polymorpha]AXC11947.1 hypothetical protein ACPOL_2634 [Acidisarcina polymorpha]
MSASALSTKRKSGDWTLDSSQGQASSEIAIVILVSDGGID